MTFLLGVILTALAILFLLTTLALATSGQLRHPMRTGGTLTAVLILGLVLLAD
jgi:hypothetical protein